MTAQLDLCLPRRETDDLLREELADLVAEANAETDPMHRCIQHGKILTLRRLLGIAPAPKPSAKPQ
jgi:hypothetical protein